MFNRVFPPTTPSLATAFSRAYQEGSDLTSRIVIPKLTKLLLENGFDDGITMKNILSSPTCGVYVKDEETKQEIESFFSRHKRFRRDDSNGDVFHFTYKRRKVRDALLGFSYLKDEHGIRVIVGNPS